MANSDAQQESTQLDDAIGVFRRRWHVGLLVFLVITVGVYVADSQRSKKYTATASLIFSQNLASDQVSGLSTSSNVSQSQQETDVYSVTLGTTASQTAKALGDHLTTDDVRNAVTAAAEAESNVVNLSATAASPTLAANIANKYAQIFVATQVTAAESTYTAAENVVSRQLAHLTASQRSSGVELDLETRLQTLQELSELQAGVVSVAQRATVPAAPSSPKVHRDTALAAIIGLGLAVGLALLLERFDSRIRDSADLEAIYGLPLLCSVPQSDAFVGGGSTPRADKQSAGDEEVFKILRAQLRYFSVSHELRVVAVVSAVPREGKSTVASHLARAAASVGSRVLLVEADLRRPGLGGALGVPSVAGLTRVLLGESDLDAATVRVSATPRSRRSRSDGDDQAPEHEESMDVLFAGENLPPNPVELLESDAMRELLAEARKKYDLVVVDTAPLALVSDAFPLLSEVDGVLVVGRVGLKHREAAKRVRTVLAGTDAQLLGVIANGVAPSRTARYGYGYGYD